MKRPKPPWMAPDRYRAAPPRLLWAPLHTDAYLDLEGSLFKDGT